MILSKERAAELLHLFFPAVCPGCDTPLLRNERLFCTACTMELPFTGMHDEPDNEVERRFWGRCPLLAGTALFHFVPGGKVQRALHRVKYEGEASTAEALGYLLGKALLASERFKEVGSVLHVPLHPKKLRERGFDQAGMIGQGVAEAMGIPHPWDLLQRVEMTPTQTRKGRFERWRNVSRAFRIKGALASLRTPVLLVDDVLTTGSTLESCAHLLLEEGKGPVAVATVASA